MAGAVSDRGMGNESEGGVLDRIFGLRAKGTNVRVELIAGMTTFLTMAYIIFVNPDILSLTGMDREALVVATCLAAAGPTIAMGLWANIPVCQAPGMGLNAFFTFTLVGVAGGGLGLKWQQALGVVFVSGTVFVVLTFLNIRELVVQAIPPVLKKSTAVGIGIFIAFLGFKSIGLIVQDPATYVAMTHHWSRELILSLVGVAIMGLLIIHRVRGSILLGILAVTFLGIGLRVADFSLNRSSLAGRAWITAPPAGPLHELGLARDDVVLRVGGTEVADPSALSEVAIPQPAAGGVSPPEGGSSAGTISGSNPPGQASPPAAASPAVTVPLVVQRSVWLRPTEVTLQATAEQLDALKAAAGPGGKGIVPLALRTFAGIPTQLVSQPANLGRVALQLSFKDLFTPALFVIIFAFMFVDLFDSVGTLIAVGYKAGLTDEDGNLPQIREALQVDALATLWGALLGTSTVVSYIESAAGAEEGGKTGLTAVFCGLFFVAALFLGPLIAAVPSYAIAPCLIIVGLAMLDHINSIDFKDFEEAIPAFMTIILMPLTHNISTGLGFGFLSYVVIKLGLGKPRDVHWMLYPICALFIVNIAFGGH
jgi:xanthine/uracil/vitamin C permease (AzgA family)